MDARLLAVTIGLLLALIAVCLLPVSADSTEDRGDGRAEVIIPRHVKTPPYRPRTWVFLAVTAVLGLVFVELRRPSMPGAYSHLVSGVAGAITGDPASVSGYAARLHPAAQFFAVAFIVGLAVVARAGMGRRVAILSHAVLYVAISVLAQALMIVAGMATHWPVGPFGVEATLANLLVGGLVVVRLTFTTFVLPRATTVPGDRPRWVWDNVLAGCSLIAVVAFLIISYAFLAEPRNATSEWQVFVPLYAVSILFALLSAPLWLLWWINRKLPQPGADRPMVDVIIPAYNEAGNIARLLRSIDVAAGRYGGPVRVLVSDDGSTDSTAQISRAEFTTFRHAAGQVLTAPNGGQAAALNRGLAVTDAEIVVRIDGDCVMGPDALVYAVPWFRDPRIGCVGGMEEPRTDTVTWFHRMRALEALFQFRFARLGQSLVDGIAVIPGTFCAFRRRPAEKVDGYPVGMNGEDSDLTMHIGRLGYRVVADPRIRTYEDVPCSIGEFVEQRTRWARAGIHTYARHVPLRSGLAGPRVWLWTMRRGFAWFSLQAGLVAPIFMLELVVAHPSYRQNVSTFLVLYIVGGAIPLIVSLPLAVKYRCWRSMLWAPTWFGYAFLRRLGTLEAVISLPTRPFPAWAATRTVGTPVPRPAAAGSPGWPPVLRTDGGALVYESYDTHGTRWRDADPPR
ncbi:MAG TPA: glycosyltransferase [Streptosporangiaceae bacterium]|nr:glycosyltransferase [Streptosporangiaceae bacterium]